jgi:DEP domain-containing protein 5
MAQSSLSARTAKLQKICTLWTHDENFAKEEVVFNSERFPELVIHHGSLVKIIALKQTTSVRDFQDDVRSSSTDTAQRLRPDGDRRPSLAMLPIKKARRNSMTITLDESGNQISTVKDTEQQDVYVFKSRPMPLDLKLKHPTLQISISETIAKAFGFRNRMQVILAAVWTLSNKSCRVLMKMTG